MNQQNLNKKQYVIEEKAKPVKTKAKAKAKPNIKITKEPTEQVEPIEEEEEEAEPVVEDKPKHIDKLKGAVVCLGCNPSMT